MLNIYEVRKELSKEKYARQRAVDPTFYHVSEVLERNELNEVMLIRMLSDICSHLHRTQKELCSYSIKYGMIEARERMSKVDFEKEYDCTWIGEGNNTNTYEKELNQENIDMEKTVEYLKYKFK